MGNIKRNNSGSTATSTSTSTSSRSSRANSSASSSMVPLWMTEVWRGQAMQMSLIALNTAGYGFCCLSAWQFYSSSARSEAEYTSLGSFSSSSSPSSSSSSALSTGGLSEMLVVSYICLVRMLDNLTLLLFPKLKKPWNAEEAFTGVHKSSLSSDYMFRCYVSDAMTLIFCPAAISIPFNLARHLNVKNPFFYNVEQRLLYGGVIFCIVMGLVYMTKDIIAFKPEQTQVRSRVNSGSSASSAAFSAGRPRLSSIEAIDPKHLKPRQKRHHLFLSVPKFILCLASLVLGLALHQKYQWVFLILSSLICLALSVMQDESKPEVQDFGFLMLLGTFLMAEWDLGSVTEIEAVH